MNNYLASIAVRTLNHTLSVRPRLGGRFEFADASSERSIDRPEPSPLTRPKPPQPELKRETASAIETTAQHETESHPKKAFDLVPRLGQSATPAPDVHPEPGTGQLTSSANVDAPQPATTRPATQPNIVEPQPENIHVEVRPVENAIHSSQRAAPRKQPRLEFRRKNHSEAPLGKADDHQPIVAEGTPRSRQRSPTTTKPISGNDELEVLTPPATAQSAITRESPVIERELETIIIREKQALDEPTRLNPSLTQSVPIPSAALSRASEEDGSNAPIIVQPSIAPLLETGLDHLLLNRPNSQPAPTVHVTIGRIEVRAVQSSQSPAKPRATTPVMNLDDYLMRRGQGGTR